MLLSLDVPCWSRNYNEQTPYDLALNNGYTNCTETIGNQSINQTTTYTVDR